jgi:SpoVK/Ycf46/Vps4 family AAA+-type ATPase
MRVGAFIKGKRSRRTPTRHRNDIVHRVAVALLKLAIHSGLFCWRRTFAYFFHTNPGKTSIGSRRNTNPEPAHWHRFYPLSVDTGIEFDDIVGLQDAKEVIMLRMILPFRYPKEAKIFGIKRGGGLLLFGPPGNGKTMLARAAATELNAPFFHVMPRDIFSGEIGKAEKNVADLFGELRNYRHAVLFLDEIDGIAPRRRGNGSTIARRVVSELLDAMDGVGKRPGGESVFILAATNQPEMVDEAFRRPGRFDTEIFVGPPDSEARKRLLNAELKNKPIGEDVDVDTLVDSTVGFSCALLKAVVDKAADRAFLRSLGKDGSIQPVSMAQLLAGCDALRRQGISNSRQGFRTLDTPSLSETIGSVPSLMA